MKCAIVLFALVVVSQAAFTGKLHQRAQPILSDAISKIHSVAGGRSSFRESEVTNSIINALQTQADNIFTQIEAAVASGQAVAATLVEHFQSTVTSLHALGADVHAGASGILSEFLSGLGGIFGGLFSGLGKSGVVAESIMEMVNQWNLDHHVSTALNSDIARWIANLINNLGAGPMVQMAVSSIMGQEMADYIFGHFNVGKAGKGIFDGVVSVASSLSAAAQQAFANIGTTISQIVDVASSNFAQLQEMATEFAHSALAQAHASASQAAASFLEFLKPYQQDMGALYQQVVEQVTSIISA